MIVSYCLVTVPEQCPLSYVRTQPVTRAAVQAQRMCFSETTQHNTDKAKPMNSTQLQYDFRN